jgi:hypothetical protein
MFYSVHVRCTMKELGTGLSSNRIQPVTHPSPSLNKGPPRSAVETVGGDEAVSTSLLSGDCKIYRHPCTEYTHLS